MAHSFYMLVARFLTGEISKYFNAATRQRKGHEEHEVPAQKLQRQARHQQPRPQRRVAMRKQI
eukprot:9725470-Lingulodinium_polyedra.AAC.1